MSRRPSILLFKPLQLPVELVRRRRDTLSSRLFLFVSTPPTLFPSVHVRSCLPFRSVLSPPVKPEGSRGRFQRPVHRRWSGGLHPSYSSASLSRSSSPWVATQYCGRVSLPRRSTYLLHTLLPLSSPFKRMLLPTWCPAFVARRYGCLYPPAASASPPLVEFPLDARGLKPIELQPPHRPATY